MVQCDIKQCAYIGDAVWELFVREICIKNAKTQKAMHNFSVKYVNASFQAHLLAELESFLTEDEKEITRKNNPQIHSLATAFEVLVGYFYINDKKRLDKFFEIVKKYLNP